MPTLSAFPKSQQVTFKYYEGVLSFLEEDYVEVCERVAPFLLADRTDGYQAEKHLTQAWALCHKDAQRNKEWGSSVHPLSLESSTDTRPVDSF